METLSKLAISVTFFLKSHNLDTLFMRELHFIREAGGKVYLNVSNSILNENLSLYTLSVSIIVFNQ